VVVSAVETRVLSDWFCFDPPLSLVLLLLVLMLSLLLLLLLLALLLPLTPLLLLSADPTMLEETELLLLSVAEALAVTMPPPPMASITAQAKTHLRPSLYILKCVRFVSISTKSLPFTIRLHPYFRPLRGNIQRYFEIIF